jgi:hypothetical protein
MFQSITTEEQDLNSRRNNVLYSTLSGSKEDRILTPPHRIAAQYLESFSSLSYALSDNNSNNQSNLLEELEKLSVSVHSHYSIISCPGLFRVFFYVIVK